METVEFKNDHDILVMLVTEVKQARYDIREIKDNTQRSIADHETRLENLEKWQSWIAGSAALFGIVVGLVTYIYFNDLNHIKTDLEKHIETSK